MTDQNVSPIRVFVIDDHRSILWGLERLIDSGAPRLQVAGTTTSCAEALKVLATASPDVILLDIDLGDENGVKEIPKLLAVTNARILILTGVPLVKYA